MQARRHLPILRVALDGVEDGVEQVRLAVLAVEALWLDDSDKIRSDQIRSDHVVQ